MIGGAGVVAVASLTCDGDAGSVGGAADVPAVDR